jgi:hypothetical protein
MGKLRIRGTLDTFSKSGRWGCCIHVFLLYFVQFSRAFFKKLQLLGLSLSKGPFPHTVYTGT